MSELEMTDYVLIVEDDEPSLQMLSMGLSKYFQVVTARSGKEAQKIAAENMPTVALLDVQMEGMDGFELCRRIKAMDGGAAVSVIFITARDTIDDLLYGYEMGGDDYIVKPCRLAELVKKINRLSSLNQQRLDLSLSVEFARNAAFSAMTNLSEMGMMIQAVHLMSLSQSERDLGMAVIEGLACFDLQCTVDIRSGSNSMTLSQSGPATELERSIIRHLQSSGRLVEFKNCIIINYENISILIMNMPVSDHEKCGRLRDYLVMLAECFDSRVRGLQIQESYTRQRELLKKVEEIVSVFDSVDTLLKKSQASIRMRLMSSYENIERMITILPLSDKQEREVLSTFGDVVNDLIEEHADFSILQNKLSPMLKGLRDAIVHTDEAA